MIRKHNNRLAEPIWFLKQEFQLVEKYHGKKIKDNIPSKRIKLLQVRELILHNQFVIIKTVQL
jgi:hypothetical protein